MITPNVKVYSSDENLGELVFSSYWVSTRVVPGIELRSTNLTWGILRGRESSKAQKETFFFIIPVKEDTADLIESCVSLRLSLMRIYNTVGFQ